MISLHSTNLKDFPFERENLCWRILRESDESLTGYWHHTFQCSAPSQAPASWYLGLVEGKAVFSDREPLSAERLLGVAERYLPQMKSDKAVHLTQKLKRMLPEDSGRQLKILPNLLENCYRANLFSPIEIERALRLKILQDFDEVLFDYSGQASFTPNSDLSDYVPVAGCDLRTLLSEARKRRIVWEKVRKIIPSLKSEFALNHEAIDRASLPASHRAHLEKIVSCGNTIETISKALSQDALEISKRLVPLIKKGLLVVKSAQQTKRSEIVIVDDSQLMLQMFQTIVSSWGYGVRAHSDPTSALNVILNADPAAIFLDVNMPDISGFDLLKQIRRQPTLADVPLIMLTAERTLSNNWRAQWSGCNFLSKPLSPEEFPNFKLELRMLLEAIAS